MGVITGAPRFEPPAAAEDGFPAPPGTVSSLLHFGQSTFLPAADAGAAICFPHEQVITILEAGGAADGAAAGAPGIWKTFLQAGQRALLPASIWGTLRTLPQLQVTCMGDPQDARETKTATFYEAA
jgi:hypothetical protein